MNAYRCKHSGCFLPFDSLLTRSICTRQLPLCGHRAQKYLIRPGAKKQIWRAQLSTETGNKTTRDSRLGLGPLNRH